MTTRMGRDGAPTAARRFVHRHAIAVRVTHWVNAICVLVMLMSGLQILNAHPALYWGDSSDFEHPLASIGSGRGPVGDERGVTTVFGHRFDTTGVLGLFHLPDGRSNARAFPPWATLPGWQSLADGRRWHFAFAWLLVLNGAVYLLWGLLAGHLWRDLVPSRRSLARIGHTLWDHLRLRFDHGEAARRYNSIQQLTYLLVIAVIVPAIILTGLAMSPRIDAAIPELPALFGGRQSARTVHFIAVALLLGFVVIHLAMVLLSGPWNNLRAMVTGRYAIGRVGDG